MSLCDEIAGFNNCWHISDCLFVYIVSGIIVFFIIVFAWVFYQARKEVYQDEGEQK